MLNKPCLTVDHRIDEEHKAHIYAIGGRLVGESVCYDFLESVREGLDEDRPNVIIDAEHLEWANSSGIGIIAAIYTSVQKFGGQVCLVRKSDRVEALVKVSGLDMLLKPCETVAKSFEGES